jgi:hypothetical protein
MRLTVVVQGATRGVTLAGDGSLRIDGDVVALRVGESIVETSVPRLAGLTWRAPLLVLYLEGGDALELGGHPGLEQVARHLSLRAMAFPEMTRTLHAFGSPRGAPGSDHDRFFDGLLRARRFVEENAELEPRLAAFSGRRLVEGFTRAFAEMASERHPERAPERRALEAELLEIGERLFDALRAMDARAEELRGAGMEERFARWRAWTDAARTAFVEADRAWEAALPALGAPPGAVGRMWRRSTRLPAMAWLALALPAARWLA